MAEFIGDTLYHLKLRYGTPIIIHRDTETTDARTGKKTTTKSTVSVKRAVLFWNQSQLILVNRLAELAANRDFTYGGWIDQGRRIFVVEAADLKGFVPKNPDYIVIPRSRERYEIETIRTLDEVPTAYMITGRIQEGAPTFTWHEARARNRLVFSQSVQVA